jgi:hypothetical protein
LAVRPVAKLRFSQEALRADRGRKVDFSYECGDSSGNLKHIDERYSTLYE